MAPSCSLHTTVPCFRRLRSPGETLAFHGRRRAFAWGALPGAPQPCLCRGTVPRDAGLGVEKKTHATKQGGMSGHPAPHDSVWLFGQLTLAGGFGGVGGRGTVAEDLYKNKGGRGEK